MSETLNKRFYIGIMAAKLKRFKEHNPVGKIDRDKGIIYGVSVITGNREASGHGMYVDETMVSQVVEQGNDNKQGLKARFDHPNPCGGSMGTVVGRFKNFRKDGLQARADLYLLESAENTPNGDYRTYILNLAEEDPDSFATSIVFRQDEPYEPQHEDYSDKDPDDPFFYPHARIKTLTHCDVVDEGAANDGLFGRPDYLAEQAERWLSEHADLIYPLIEKRIDTILNKNKKEMSDSKDSVSFKDRFLSIFQKAEEKTDEQLKQEFDNAIKDVQELSNKLQEAENTNSDLADSVGALQSEYDDYKVSKELEIEELQGQISEMQAKLSEAGVELPTPSPSDKQEPAGGEQLSAEEKKRREFIENTKALREKREAEKKQRFNNK